MKIAVGGRAATKTIAFSDCFLKFCDDGEKLLCAREHQNSLEQSVHSSMRRRISHYGIETLNPTTKKITSQTGGEIFYWGLARNIGSVKSLDGVNRVWIEEGQYISQESIDVLFPTIRENNSEIWISMNRGSSKDPVSKEFLLPYEHILERDGFYEDEYLMIVEINWYDNPWFPEKLNQQRIRAKKIMSRAKYDHIWGGAYSDTVENAIIEPEWFDACIDAHIKIGFEPEGVEVVSHDPFDGGNDPAGLAYRHGSVFKEVLESSDGRVNDACRWALDFAIEVGADEFVWDADGVGAGLREQVGKSLKGKKMSASEFHGQAAVDNPDQIYNKTEIDIGKARSNRETFTNKRAQWYWILRDRMFKTYLAVTEKKWANPDELISFSSEITALRTLRAEICRIPKKPNGAGKIQILSKPEMKALKIDSPNLADSVMMNLSGTGTLKKPVTPIEYDSFY